MRCATLIVLLVCALAAPAAADRHLAHYMDGIDICLANTDDGWLCIGAGSENCMQREEAGMSTHGMVQCMGAERDAWDRLLNAEYRRARDLAAGLDARDKEWAPDYAVRAEQLRDAQRAWIPFRDANCAMEAGAWGEGTFAQVLMAECHMRMTAERAIDLQRHRRWFEGELN